MQVKPGKLKVALETAGQVSEKLIFQELKLAYRIWYLKAGI